MTCWAIGLGSASRAATPSWPTGLDGMASMTRRDLSTHGLEADQTTEINIDTLDRWAASKHVEHISLLKIDVEGHESDGLEGAQGLLDRRAVDAVQFEFGGAAIDTRTYLRDFYRLLGPGFDVCRILPDGLSAPIHESERNEIFLLHNYVALRTR